MRAKEFNQPKRDLIIFDIDDTLLHTTAQISVVKNGQVIRKLTNQEFNHYQLQPGEEFDFGEFRDAEKFNRESKPIEPMVNKLKTILAHSANSDVIMLTARADFDNKNLVIKTFNDLGIDMSRVHIHRAGNLPGDAIPAEKKAVYVRKYADTGKYDHIRLYDDSKTNLVVFKALEQEYPNIDFRAYYVGPEGSATPVSEAVDHQLAVDFVDMFKKFLPLAMKELGINSLPKMQFEPEIHPSGQPSFGMYANRDHILYVALKNRHPIDILRTVAHELVHYRQDLNDELNDNSGETGSPQENQANELAGVIMRNFNKKHPEFLASKPLTESQELDELDVSKTMSFVKKAHGKQMYGDKPYWTHPQSVAATGKKFFGNKFTPDAVRVALLHDVVEDTPYKLEQLGRMGYSPEVVDAVRLLTKNKALSYAENIQAIINSGNRLAMMVKYADNYQNYTGDKSHWPADKAASSQKKYLASLNMLGDKLGIQKHL